MARRAINTLGSEAVTGGSAVEVNLQTTTRYGTLESIQGYDLGLRCASDESRFGGGSSGLVQVARKTTFFVSSTNSHRSQFRTFFESLD